MQGLDARTIFPHKLRRARLLAAIMTLSLHVALASTILMAYLWSVYARAKNEAATFLLESVPEKTPLRVADFAVEKPDDTGGMSRSEAMKKLITEKNETDKLHETKKLERLGELSNLASGISDNSMEEIAKFLGAGKKIEPRTYYLDAGNPNINFARSRLARAFRFLDETGDAGYTLTLADLEKDEFTFSVRGDNAKKLDRLFPAKTTAAKGKSEPVADLSGFGLTGIARKEDAEPKFAWTVSFADNADRKFSLDFYGGAAQPFFAQAMRFRQRADGQPLVDNDSEETINPGNFDSDAAVVYNVTRLPDVDGQPRVKVVLLDRNGERFIVVHKGEEARQYLGTAKVYENETIKKCADIMMRLLPEIEKTK